MKKKHVIISIIVGIFLVLLAIAGIIYFKYGREDNFNNKEEVQGYRISDIVEINDSNIRYHDDFYLKETNKGFEIYDLNSNILYEEPNNKTYVVNNELITFEESGKHYAIDKNGNTIIDEYDFSIYDPVKNEYYYVKSNVIYDSSSNVIYTLPESYDFVDIYGDFILVTGADNALVNLNDGTSKELLYYYLIGENDFILVNSEGKFILCDLNSSKEIAVYEDYHTYTVNGQYIYKLINGEEIDLIVDGEFINGERDYLTDNIYVDYGACSNGGMLKSDNKAIIDECYNGFYYLGQDKYLAFMANYDAELYNDGKVVATLEEPLVAGDYILSETDVLELYNSSGEKIDLNISRISLFNNSYLANILDVWYILNEKLEVKQGPYKKLECNDYACIFKDLDNNYGILLDEKEVFKSKEYLDLELQNNLIIGSTYDKTYIYEISDEGNSLELNIENKDFKTKFEYIVDNNSNIKDFKKEVLNLYPLIEKNSDLLEESYLLDSLWRLKIYEDDTIGENYTGLYQDYDKLIRYKIDDDSVIYHELIHFLDHSISEGSFKAYVCGGEYLDYEQFAKLSLEEMKDCESVNVTYANFMTEAGAEITTAKNYIKNITTYKIPCDIYTALENIFGSLLIDKVFMHSETDYLLLKLFLDNDFTIEEYQRYVALFNSYVTNSEDSYKVADALIDIYSQVKDNNWFEDKEFVYIISSIIKACDYSGSKYYNELQEYLYQINFYDEVVSKIDGDKYSVRVTPFDCFYIDGEFYFVIQVWADIGSGQSTEEEILVNYDFNSGSVKDFELI